MFATRFEKALAAYPAKEYAIIIDSKFLTHSGKMVYVKIEENSSSPQIVFYTRTGSSNSRSTEEQNKVVLFKPYDLLSKKLSKTVIGGIDVGGTASLDAVKITICESMGLIVMESQLYHAIRTIVENDEDNTKSFMFSGEILDSAVVRKLCKAFRLESIKLYGDLVCSNSSPRFVNKLNRYNKFYTIQKAFIPVFIDYPYVFNPLLHDNAVKNTKVYKEVQRVGRLVHVDNVSGYYMTHDELCLALGMTRRVRFTPHVFYQVFMGLLYPNLEGLASKSEGFYVRTELKTDSGLKTKYSEYDMRALVEKLQKDELAATSDMEKSFIKKQVQELSTYRRIDGLTVLCMENNARMTNIGPHLLDKPEDTKYSKIREYLDEAKIIV